MTTSQPSKATADDALIISVVHEVVRHPRWCAL
jgi:hypothetical protein